MEIHCKRLYCDLVVELSGELDSSMTEPVRQQIEEAYLRAHAQNLIFDFSRITFMDSSIIGLIVGRYKLVSAYGGKVFLTGVNSRMDRIFTAAGLYRLAKKTDSIKKLGRA